VNTRRYPRTMQEAFGPYTDDRLEPMDEPRRPLLRAAIDGFTQPFRMLASPFVFFAEVWWQYRRAHSWRYAARIAYEIAFNGQPF
jgi:hypothetical protein